MQAIKWMFVVQNMKLIPRNNQIISLTNTRNGYVHCTYT